MDLTGLDRAESLPFISRHFEDWTRLVFLRTAGGHLVPVGRRLKEVWGGLSYEAISEFVVKYGDVISMGTEVSWSTKSEIDLWLDRVTYLSFICVPYLVTSNFWFKCVLGDGDSRETAEIPQAYHSTFEGQLKDQWVLLKVKGKVWPVRVTNNRFYEGWSAFWDDTNLFAGLTILFGARMKWVFEVIIVGPNGRARNYNWDEFGDDVPECDYLASASDASITSCLPAILAGEKFLIRFGYSCEYGSALYQVLAARFENVTIPTETENVVFVMQSKEWVVPVVGNQLERASLRTFVGDLKLVTWDYVFVSVVEAALVRILIFGPDGLEKLGAI